MYVWIWRHLPGNNLVKFGFSVLIFAALIYALFLHVFPWADTWLPFNQVTVDQAQPAAAGAMR